jgi:hypothetical protein
MGQAPFLRIKFVRGLRGHNCVLWRRTGGLAVVGPELAFWRSLIGRSPASGGYKRTHFTEDTGVLSGLEFAVNVFRGHLPSEVERHHGVTGVGPVSKILPSFRVQHPTLHHHKINLVWPRSDRRIDEICM